MGGPGMDVEEVKNQNKALTEEKTATAEEKNKQIKQNDQDVNPPVRSKQEKEKLSKDALEIAEPQPGMEPQPNVAPQPSVGPQPSVVPQSSVVSQPNVESQPNVDPQPSLEETQLNEEQQIDFSQYNQKKLKAYRKTNVGKALAQAKEVHGKETSDLLPEEQAQLAKKTSHQNILNKTKKASKIFHLVKGGLGILNQISVGLGLSNKDWKD
ncbi:MAG: hypothetical protein RR705_10185, partial [Lachnospiraceae bacterium]